MTDDLAPVIAASTRWLLTAYPAPGGAFDRALSEVQARQAVTLAATLRHPTDLDIQLLHLLAPSGSHRLDRLSLSARRRCGSNRDPSGRPTPGVGRPGLDSDTAVAGRARLAALPVSASC
ncbi:hypothetical protein ACIRQQ_46865 [Streptomyces fuscichromogenes]|uniref:hypothetical protein n=1 Tax=Streptomyces fuscichromogenes TaxID=1324013 RepID=UPI0037F2483C